MSQDIHTVDVSRKSNTLLYVYGRRQAGEHAPHKGTDKKKIPRISEISELAGEITRALAGCDVSNLQELGKTLYNGIIPDKFGSALTKWTGGDLVFYLDPKMSWVPWELLHDGTQFLCHRFRVSRSLLKSGVELEVAEERAKVNRRGGVLILKGQVTDPQLAADEEIAEIGRILIPVFGDDRFIVRSASSKNDAIRYLMNDYDVCHFIGHGVFSEKHPKDSGWRFPDGSVLTCAHIENITLPGAIFPRLIIANSCDSARSATNDAQKYVSSLYRSFLSKGVPHYIGTVARIPDDVSQRFSTLFYRALATGKNMGDALFEARKAASVGVGWAFYVHYGDPGFPLLVSSGKSTQHAPTTVSASEPITGALHTLIVEVNERNFRYQYTCREGETVPAPAVFQKSVDLAEIQTLAKNLLRTLASSFPNELDLRRWGGKIFDRLIPRQLGDMFRQDPRFPYLLLYLDTALSWIPWELLWDGKQFFCCRFRLSRFLQPGPGPRVVEERLQEAPGRGALIVLGDISGLEVEAEIAAVKESLESIYGNNLWFYAGRSASDILEELEKDYELCHFVGHGQFDISDASKTGWRFPDGSVLSCHDIEAVASRSTFPRLIFANSSNSARSALPDAHAYITKLYASFLKQGALQYIGTISSIPDSFSRGFALCFYRLLAAGASVGEALFEARRLLSEKAAIPIWAYYVHYGDPTYRFVAKTGTKSAQSGERLLCSQVE